VVKMKRNGKLERLHPPRRPWQSLDTRKTPEYYQVMSIWNKILLGFVFVAAVAFFYMAMRTLKTHQYWRALALGHQQKIKELREENSSLISADPKQGEDGQMGIVRLRLELNKLLIDRGRVWYNCSPEQIDPATGGVRVKTDLPDPHRIGVNTNLYVFDETDLQDGGRYLGEFEVTDVAQQQVALEPAMKVPPEELKRLAASKGPWTLYEIMPLDARSVFAHLSEEEKKALLPDETQEEYLKDGEPAEPDDPEDRVVEVKDKDGNVVERKYVRMLRDYEVLFKEYHLQRSILVDLFEATKRDKQYVDNAYADALSHQQFREDEVRKLKVEVATHSRERDAVAALLATIQPRAQKMKEAVDLLIAANRATAAKIAKIQLEAARRIDARTQTMVRSAGTAN